MQIYSQRFRCSCTRHSPVDQTPMWTEICPCWMCPFRHWAAELEQYWGQWLVEGGERVWPGPVELKARAAYLSPTPLDPPMLLSDHGPEIYQCKDWASRLHCTLRRHNKCYMIHQNANLLATDELLPYFRQNVKAMTYQADFKELMAIQVWRYCYFTSAVSGPKCYASTHRTDYTCM